MSRTNRNFLIAYILLVGLPVVGLVGVLKAGNNLNAPVSVDGIWKFQTARSGSFPCLKSLDSFQDTEVAISQSGKSLVMNLNNGAKGNGSGIIEGTTLRALFHPSAAPAREDGCGGDQLLALTATVDPKTEPRTLVGMLSIHACESCTTVKFHAVQAKRASGKGAQ